LTHNSSRSCVSTEGFGFEAGEGLDTSNSGSAGGLGEGSEVDHEALECSPSGGNGLDQSDRQVVASLAVGGTQ